MPHQPLHQLRQPCQRRCVKHQQLRPAAPCVRRRQNATVCGKWTSHRQNARDWPANECSKPHDCQCSIQPDVPAPMTMSQASELNSNTLPTMSASPSVITHRPIRFAVIGCGRISANHCGAIKQHAGRAELVGVCDIDPTALAAAVAQTGAPAYPNLDALLAQCEHDVLVLSTPSGLHSSQAVQAARAGRHVLSEKPMATKFEDGQAMVRACHEAGVKLFVVKQNRLNATVQLVKRAIDQNRFGRIYMATVNVFWSRPQSLLRRGTLARSLGPGWRCLHEPSQPLR